MVSPCNFQTYESKLNELYSCQSIPISDMERNLKLKLINCKILVILKHGLSMGHQHKLSEPKYQVMARKPSELTIYNPDIFLDQTVVKLHHFSMFPLYTMTLCGVYKSIGNFSKKDKQLLHFKSCIPSSLQRFIIIQTFTTFPVFSECFVTWAVKEIDKSSSQKEATFIIYS